MLYDCRFKRLDGQEVFLMDMKEKITELADGFSSCSKMLIAIGDVTRQHLILEIMKMGNCSGVRVGEITEKTNLSRPAVSHRLQIMKDAGIVKVCNYREGMPEWFLNGMGAALLAPTAMNQQKFYFELLPSGSVKLTNGKGFYTKLDLGIVKYHFEAVSKAAIL